MRRVSVLVAVLAIAASAGCLRIPAKPTPTPSRESRSVVVSVYLDDDATETQKDAVGSALRETSGVTRVTFVTREEAYERFKKAFGRSPGPLASVGPDDLPESFLVEMRDRKAADAAAVDMRRLSGVDEVVVPPVPTATPAPTST
ncbi:MAG: hypothetical protein GEV10_20715 [Streptosporangiales bacterium]|nr:hypothetical protein [Streptosporangiales bacterium]